MKKILLLLLFGIHITLFSQETISEIKFDGQKRTKVSYLEKYLGINIDERVEKNTLEKAIQNLKNLPMIYDATYSLKKNEEGNTSLFIQIQETRTGLPYFNFGNGDYDNWFELGFSEHNFLGLGYSVGGVYHWQGKSSFIFNSRFPLLFGKHFGAGFNVTLWKVDEPLYFQTGETVLYEYNLNAFEPVLIYDLRQNNYIELAFTLFKEHYVKLGHNLDALPGPDKLTQNKYALKLNYNFNRVNYHHFYLDGIASKVQVQFVKTDGKQDDYSFFLNDFMYYKRLGESGNFASRLRFGLATNNRSPFSPFAVDNHTNIRGVGDRVDRGTGTLVLNLEYRHAVFETPNIAVQAAVFSDNGTWRTPGGEFDELFSDFTLIMYGGPGARFMWKKWYQAILRIDYGISIYGRYNSGFTIGLGQYF